MCLTSTQLNTLRHRCLAHEKAFHKEGECLATRDGPLVFRDNGSNILGVAHLDTVCNHRHFAVSRSRKTVFNAQLDDRLGAWVLLDLLPSMGVNIDVLLTTGEEQCNSTAHHFLPPKQYNWIVEFDRRGTDVVTYQYNNPQLLDGLQSAGWQVGWGSYSDICDLEHLGVSGLNVGVGYYDNHSPSAYCRLPETLKAVRRFQRFYGEFRNIELPHTPVELWDPKDEFEPDPYEWAYWQDQPKRHHEQLDYDGWGPSSEWQHSGKHFID